MESDLTGNLKSQYVFFDGRRMARRDFPSGTVSYYFSDHLETADVITDSGGNITQDEDFYPWGGNLSFVNNDSNHYKFTGKERDLESGLDYFGKRHYGNYLGRFLSPDSIANDWELRNPQTWNRYVYARDNPVIYCDPDGAAVELLGDKKQRQAELDELKKDVGNKEAAKRLYINEVKDGDKTRYFVGIKGDVGDFMKLSDSSHDLANVVINKGVVEFGLTDRDLSYWGGANTYERGEDHGQNQNVRVLVNPEQVHDIGDVRLRLWPLGQAKFAGQLANPAWTIKPLTTGIAVWHELGHGWGMINGRSAENTGAESIAWENRMREQSYGPLGPDNAKRVSH